MSASSPAPRLTIALASVAAASLVAPVTVLPGQTASPVTVAGVERFALKSARTGVEYRIDVWLPPGLDTMTVRPPVLYVTDGNLLFPLATAIYEPLALLGELPPVILVGIGYPDTVRSMSQAWLAGRTRDYTPTLAKNSPAGSSGESAAYLAFLKDDVVPFVESRWRTDASARGLAGHSLGGLFATYALLHEPALFHRVWIGSPSYWWDGEVAFSWLGAAKSRPVQPSGRAFLSVGSVESDLMVPPMQRMATRLRATFPQLNVDAHVYPDETHVSVIAGAVTTALRFLYGDLGRRTIALSRVERDGYAGRWKGKTSGRVLTIVNRGTQLSLTISESGQTVSAPLFAESADFLFARMFAARITAERDDARRIVRLRGAVAGPEEVFERAR